MRCIRVAIGLMMTAASAVPAPLVAQDVADAVYRNGKIYTVDDAQPWAEAVAIKDGRFLAVGTSADMDALIDDATQVVELGGAMVLPGLVDHHTHPSIDGYMRSQCELPGAFVEPTFEDILAAIEACRADAGNATWFISSGHTASAWPPDKYNKAFLDEIFGDMPAYLEDETAHNALVNSAALAIAGIDDDTPDPDGGIIERDANGEATGHIIEFGALDLIKPHLPERDLAAQVKGLAWAIDLFNQYGFTTFGDAQVFEDDLRIYEQVVAGDDMTAHATLYLQALGYGGEDSVVTAEAIKAMIADHDLPDVNYGAKLFIDGSIEGTTAYLVEPYEGVGDGTEDLGTPRVDGPDAVADEIGENEAGSLTIPFERMIEIFADLDAHNVQMKVHAIGDRGVRTTLDLYEELIEARGSNQLNHHIDHLNMVHPDDIARFAELGVPAGPYPSVAAPNGYQMALIKPMLGEARFLERTLPIGSLVRAGAVVAFKSDWASIPIWPFYGMEVAITRSVPGDPSLGALNADEGIDVGDAIRGYTLNGAIILNRADETGSIEVGKWADMVVIDQQLFDIPHEDIHKTNVEMTVFKGEPVYVASERKAERALPTMVRYVQYAALLHCAANHLFDRQTRVLR